MNGNQMNTLAMQVPTSIEELSDCALPQNVIKLYGGRIVRTVTAYIATENLQQHVDSRPKKKKQKLEGAGDAKAGGQVVIDVPDDSDGEFGGDDDDFLAVELPGQSGGGGRDPLSQKAEQGNPYNQKKPAAAKKSGAKKPAAKKAGSKLKSKNRSSYF